MSDEAPTRWTALFLLLFAGAVGAAQLGKLPGALPTIRADMEIGLVTAGWLISTIVLIGAAASVWAGMIGDRLGHRRVLLWSAALVALGSLAGAMAGGTGALIASRVVEGVGYIGVIAAAPVLIVRASAPRDRAMAFGIWSLYMPIGMATMVALSPPLMTALGGWRGLWLANAAFAAAAALVLLPILRGARFAHARPPTPVGPGDVWRTVSRAAPWVIAIGMGAYSLVYLSAMAYMPTYLVERRGMTPETAALLIGIAIFMNAPGCLVGGWLTRRGGAAWAVIASGYIGMAVCAYGLYQDGIAFGLRYALALALPFFGGLVPPVVLDRAQAHAPSPAVYGTMMGLVIQMVSLGQFVGPPVLAAVVTATGDWQSGAWLTVSACGLGLGMALALRHLDGQLDRSAALV